MQVALHGKSPSQDSLQVVKSLLQNLTKHQARLVLSPPLQALLQAAAIQCPATQPWDKGLQHLDLMVSVGGDGTLLEAVNYVAAAETPVLGINTGRMGFLATVAPKEGLAALARFWQGQHSLDKRTLLQVAPQGTPTLAADFALNEVAVLKCDSSSMIAIHVYIDEKLCTTYWADGLIVATPTGSTGYSLSCGGPIVLPSAHNLVITPVSPHNLAVRPLVVPDSAVLTLRVESSNQKFLVTLDGRSRPTNTDTELVISKAPFQAQLVKVDTSSLFDVLRQKLHWGLDVRN